MQPDPSLIWLAKRSSIAFLIFWLALPVAAKPDKGMATKADSLGDPLPEGAIARIGTTRFRHGERISTISLSKDGLVLASGSSDRYSSARVWSAKTGKLLMAVENEGPGVALSPDGRTLVVSGKDTNLRVYDVDSGKQTRQIRLAGTSGKAGEGTWGVKFSPDGRRLAVVESWYDPDVNISPPISKWAIRLIKFADGENIERVSASVFGFSLPFAISPDGETLATVGDRQSTVQIWETATGKLRSQFKVNGGTSCAFSPDGKTLAIGQQDAIRLFDLKTHKETRALVGFPTKDAYGPGELTFSPDGTYLAGGGSSYEEVVRIWDTRDGKIVREIAKPFSSGCPLTFMPDGKTLIGAADSVLRQWDVATGKESILADMHRFGLSFVAHSPDGKSLAIADEENVRVYETTTYKEIQRLPEKWVRIGAYSPSGNQIATAGEKLSLFDAKSGKKVQTFDGHKLGLSGVVFTDDETVVSSSYDGTLRWWRTTTGQKLALFDAPLVGRLKERDRVVSLAVAPRSKALVYLGGRACLLDTETKQIVRDFAAYHWDSYSGQIAVSPDGSLLACEGQANTWDTVVVHQLDGKKPAQKLGQIGNGDVPHWGLTFAFSPDNKLLASGGADRTVRLWDLATGNELHKFTGHIARVSGISFAPDGNTMATSSADGTVLIWDTGRFRK